MILTITLNPAVDVTYEVDELVPHATHRVRAVREQAGGKGVNVSRVLHQVGHPTMATGLLGGPTGDLVRGRLAAAGIETAFTPITATTRRTVVVTDTEDATVFNEPGPAVTDAEWSAFTGSLNALSTGATCVVMSGSLPAGVDPAAYAELCALLPVPAVVDTSGPALLAAAEAGANLLKPNAAELSEATGIQDTYAAAQHLRDRGATTVVVTRGADGMLAVTPDGTWSARLGERIAGNPTGAGDAATAALAAGHATGADWPERLREAVAWSAAAVPVPHAGEVDLPTLDRLRPLVTVTKENP
ncbi:tagatose 6-phosphate kinase [Nocardioides luteus]|uniref:Sugar kinase n=1 Tax=Nocardioides luteus TaxID=1844 RepID=A0ABQ5SX06_9ACTN|nr:hexose kinase [Nocardioides luteus]MDR7312253.1 tagatose 6-phosphate kinase [Nocardioides luteus]GGR57036.1 sugar kinase [Nocardioides luteus]GLJ68499.1 sugar kinase [Nocardioides luteus]